MTNESGVRPIEYNVVLRMDAVEQRTASGIILPDSKTARDEMSADEGTLIAISPHAFTYAEWGDQPMPKVGDRVLFAQHDGRLWERGGIKYRILKDKSLIAVLDQPALAAAA